MRNQEQFKGRKSSLIMKSHGKMGHLHQLRNTVVTPLSVG